MLLAALVVAGCSSSNVGDAGSDPMPDMSTALQVAKFGDQSLGLEEFEEEYARSVGGRDVAAADSLPMYNDFLDRYVDFRLKVLYAKEIGLEQDSTLLAEIDTYRNQLARPYLLEKEILDPILRDLYVRKQNMVDASHILVRAGQAATPEELQVARAKMEAIKDSIDMGIDFNDLAFRNSEDPSARGQRSGARGRLGYFGGGQMVKPFEDRAYSTPVDSVSEIFKTDFGYHILKIHDRRAKVADVWASHIAVRYFKPSTLDTLDSEGRIALIKEKLDAGADFAELAKEESEDLDSGSRGGQIGRLRFTQQGMPDAFKEALFALENPGDYSDIIKTDYGYHIIKLDKRQEHETFDDAYEELKNHASRLPRLKKAENAMAKQIREEHGIQIDTTLTLEILNGRHFGVPDILQTPANQMDMEIASLGDETFTFRDVVNFVETASIPFQPDTLDLVYDALERFMNDEALNYEAARLEGRDESFKKILDEFKNGLLLFKLMEDSVWTAAAQDTAGLMKYHAPRADSFWFEDRTRIVSFRANADSVLRTLAMKLDDGSSLSDLVNMVAQDEDMMIRVDSTYLAGPNQSIFDRALALEKGEYVSPTRHTTGFLLMVNDGISPARMKTFEEARSEVLNGYQTQLEEQLLDRLHKKYGIKKMPAPLSGAFAEDKAARMKDQEIFDNKVPNSGQ